MSVKNQYLEEIKKIYFVFMQHAEYNDVSKEKLITYIGIYLIRISRSTTPHSCNTSN